MVEIWDGSAWGRCGTDAEGRYGFVAVKPGGRRGAVSDRARVRPRAAEAAF